MTDTQDDGRAARRARHTAIRDETAQEEAEAAESATTLDVPLHLRIDRQLDEQLRQRAAAEQIPTSALVRRLLRQAAHEHRTRLADHGRSRGDRPPRRTRGDPLHLSRPANVRRGSTPLQDPGGSGRWGQV